MPRHANLLDVVIAGGGPAGLSAALILGRCLRRVLVLDTDRPRNAASHGLHGFLTRDGIHPRELRDIARDQLAPYSTVRLERAAAVGAARADHGFDVSLDDGRTVAARKLLLATGVVDELPEVSGFDAVYGRSAHHCPYCDGWEWRGQPIAALGRRTSAYNLALKLTGWSHDIVACTNGPAGLTGTQRRRLAAAGITLREERITALESTEGWLERILFVEGPPLERRALFFSFGQRQASDLAAQLGCGFTRKGAVRTGEYEVTDVPGLYVAGDASRLVQLAIVAAAQGAQAAFAINTALMDEEGLP